MSLRSPAHDLNSGVHDALARTWIADLGVYPPKNAPFLSCAIWAKLTSVTEVDWKLPRLELPDQRMEAPVRTKASANRLVASFVVPRSTTRDHSTSKLTVAGTEGPLLRAFGRLP